MEGGTVHSVPFFSTGSGGGDPEVAGIPWSRGAL